ncbi:MAG: methyl-accepting chemotaxis protein [Ramlibacter sp.]|nr:methyl-accepting chemotaxis protein [Ramlibacter sp.]
MNQVSSSMEQVKVRLFRRSTIRVRLTLAFSSVALLLVAIAAVGAWRLDELSRVATANLQAERVMGNWLAEIQANEVRAAVLMRSTEPATRQGLEPELNAASQRIAVLQKNVEGLLSTSQTRTLFEQIGARRKVYLEAMQAVLEKQQAGQAGEAAALLENSFVPASRAYLASTRALADFHGGEVEGNSANSRQAAAWGQLVIIGVCAVAIILGFTFSWLITSAIVRPLRFAAKLSRQVAGGDLTVQVHREGRDEAAQLLQALAEMMANLRTVLGEVTQGAHIVTASSARIAQGNVDLLRRTAEQASTLEQTASSIEQLTSTVAQNAGHARHASQLAVGASEAARKGGEVVGQVVTTMSGISASSRKIADIIGVIDAIAFQTNILALNAAVEAARAGGQGRGFAVVAGEVRTLAQRSAAAAQESTGLIGDSVTQVDAGTVLADAAGQTMAQIVASFREVTDLVTEIAAASQEQSSGIAQVNMAVTQMERVVQQNAALVEEATVATESMKTQAGSLLQMVSRFRLEGTAGAVALRMSTSPTSGLSADLR